MDLYVQDTCRERARAILAAAVEPLTSIDIAHQLGTTVTQAGRALRQLGQQGAATRSRGGMSQRGRVPDQWTATR